MSKTPKSIIHGDIEEIERMSAPNMNLSGINARLPKKEAPVPLDR